MQAREKHLDWLEGALSEARALADPITSHNAAGMDAITVQQILDILEVRTYWSSVDAAKYASAQTCRLPVAGAVCIFLASLVTSRLPAVLLCCQVQPWMLSSLPDAS